MIKALTIFSGNANRDLAEAICKCVEVRPGAAEVTTFSDGEIFVEIGENVRGVNCFVVQPTSAPHAGQCLWASQHGPWHAGQIFMTPAHLSYVPPSGHVKPDCAVDRCRLPC